MIDTSTLFTIIETLPTKRPVLGEVNFYGFEDLTAEEYKLMLIEAVENISGRDNDNDSY